MRSEDLMRNAFTALHTAKERGRAEVVVFEQAMHSSALSRLDLEQDLRYAVENKGLDVYFQPLMNLSKRKPSRPAAGWRLRRSGRPRPGS